VRETRDLGCVIAGVDYFHEALGQVLVRAPTRHTAGDGFHHIESILGEHTFLLGEEASEAIRCQVETLFPASSAEAEDAGAGDESTPFVPLFAGSAGDFGVSVNAFPVNASARPI